MCTVWRQVHVLGQFKAGDKPNRAELVSILKAGGASLVGAAEPGVDLAIMHSRTPRNNPKVIAKSFSDVTFVRSSVICKHTTTSSHTSQRQRGIIRRMDPRCHATGMRKNRPQHVWARPLLRSLSRRSWQPFPTEVIPMHRESHVVLTSSNDAQVTSLLRAKVCCASPSYIVEWLAKPKQALGQYLLFKSKPGSVLSKLAKERHLSLDPAESASL